MPTRLAEVIKRGFSSTVGITKMNFSRADGSEYTVSEVHYIAPDDTLVLVLIVAATRKLACQSGHRHWRCRLLSFMVDSIEQSSRFFNEVWAMSCAVK